MPGGHDDSTIAQAYLEHRPYLVDLAFRMLGDVGAAEDAVQDAFARLVRSGPGDIDDERGWLIVVTSRLCLDQIRSARSRRELASDPGQLEAVASRSGGELADPADRVTLDDSVRLALLVVLQRLTPAERVVLVLHDVFQVPFDAVAEATGRTVPACRQLATRARRKLAGHGTASPGVAGHGMAGLTATGAEHRRVTEKFIAAASRGDLDAHMAVLAPGAWGEVDYGPGAASPVVTGAARVARNLVRFWGPPATLVSFPGDAQPVLLGFIGREPRGILVLSMRGEAIQGVRVIADPAALDFLAAQLAVTFAAAIPSLPVPPRARWRRAALPALAWTETEHAHARPDDHPAARRLQAGGRARRSGEVTPGAPAGAAGSAGAIDPVRPALLVRVVIRPLTRLLNPVILKRAGREGFQTAAQIRHTGRRSGRPYVTPASARLRGDVIVIPLTFGNQSDWVRNIVAAGHCSIRLDGQDYEATEPRFLSRDQAGELLKPMFSPMERASFRMLGIRQLLRLHATLAPAPAQETASGHDKG